MNTVPTQPKSDVPGLDQLDTFRGSDKAFGDRAAATYEELAKQAKASLPSTAKPEEIKAKIVELAEPILKTSESGGELTAKAAEAMRKSIKEAKDAQDFARLLTQDRDKIVADTPGPKAEASEKMLAFMMQFLEKILAAFGVKLDGPQQAGGGRLSNTFASASGQTNTSPTPTAAAPATATPAADPTPATPAAAAPSTAAPAVVVGHLTPQQRERIQAQDLAAASAAVATSPRLPTEQDELAAMILVPDRPASEFRAPGSQTFEQRLDVALPIKPEGPFTVVLAVPPAPPLKVDLAQSNTLAGLFNLPADPQVPHARVDARPQPQMIADVEELEMAARKPKTSANDSTYALAG